MIITKDSHLDHGLTVAQIAFITDRFSARDGFFIESFTLPEELGTVPCALYGPAMGDAPVNVASWAKRPGREYSSRLVNLPPRPTRTITVIAGPHSDDSCVLYTAFGGPVAPKEIADPALAPGTTEYQMSVKFWSEHALAAPRAE